MKEVVPDQLVLQGLEGVLGVTEVTAVKPRPIDKVCAAGAAAARSSGVIFLSCLKQCKIVAAIGIGAFDVERKGLLKFGHG